MKISRQIVTIVLLSALFLSSCRTKQDGSIEGTVLPPGTSAHITALQYGKDILTISAGIRDGKFKLSLTAGVYTIKVAVYDSPFPLKLNNITVKSGELTELAPIKLTPPSGTGGLTGKIIPPLPDVEITLIFEVKERAAVHADRDGKYEFKEVPAGTYVVQTNAPGHADDAILVVITDNQKIVQNAVLLSITAIAGLDGLQGKFYPRATACRRKMPQPLPYAGKWQNALPLQTLRGICLGPEIIRIDADQTVKSAMRSKYVALIIEGFFKGYTIVSKRELENGRSEVVLELPLTGPAGLTRYIAE